MGYYSLIGNLFSKFDLTNSEIGKSGKNTTRIDKSGTGDVGNVDLRIGLSGICKLEFDELGIDKSRIIEFIIGKLANLKLVNL